jgi:hypothetical protein
MILIYVDCIKLGEAGGQNTKCAKSVFKTKINKKTYNNLSFSNIIKTFKKKYKNKKPHPQQQKYVHSFSCTLKYISVS